MRPLLGTSEYAMDVQERMEVVQDVHGVGVRGDSKMAVKMRMTF